MKGLENSQQVNGLNPALIRNQGFNQQAAFNQPANQIQPNYQNQLNNQNQFAGIPNQNDGIPRTDSEQMNWAIQESLKNNQ